VDPGKETDNGMQWWSMTIWVFCALQHFQIDQPLMQNSLIISKNVYKYSATVVWHICYTKLVLTKFDFLQI
jgi:hypothetical protein